jgi:hypothetical protein
MILLPIFCNPGNILALSPTSNIEFVSLYPFFASASLSFFAYAFQDLLFNVTTVHLKIVLTEYFNYHIFLSLIEMNGYIKKYCGIN